MFNYVILLLLYWPCVWAQQNHSIIDQIPTASENITVLLSKNPSHNVTSQSNINTIHYENSNGFVPMIVQPESRTGKFYKFTENFTSINADNNNKNTTSGLKSEIYSPEARIFFNLPQPTANRRSFETGQKEFEILKVKDKTPAIANYHEFYENLQSNMNSNTGISSINQNAPLRTRDRIKQIDDYLSYTGDKYRVTNNPYTQYYTAGNSRETQKKTFEPEKVRSANYHHHHHHHQQQHEHSASDYDIFGENVTRQRATSLNPTNDDSIDNLKSRNKPSTSAKQRHSTPVIIVDPSAYPMNVHYDTQSSAKVPTNDNTNDNTYNYQKEISEDRYDRNEDYSDENSDYYEITERPRRTHKSRRKPYNTDASRKLPKEHRGSADTDDLKKIKNKIKSQRGRGGRPSNWSSEEHTQEHDESVEVDGRKGKPQYQQSQDNTDKQQYNNGNTNTWSQIGPNVEVSQSNGYELSQIDKPNVLVPVNLNLVPLGSFDQSTLAANSAFDMSSGLQNFITAGPMVSTASPLISSHQPIIMTPQSAVKNLHNTNYAYSTAVPDIIVGQNSYHNPVQTVILPQSVQKYTPNMKTFISSTASPLFTMSSTTSVASSKVNPITATAATTAPQTFYPQSTVQHSPHIYNVLVNPNGLHGQNSQSTTPSTINNNVNSQSKKNTFTGSNGHFLASTSFSVGHQAQTHDSHANDNKYYVPANVYPVLKNDNSVEKFNSYIQTQMVPAYIQATPGISTMNMLQNPSQQFSANPQQQSLYTNKLHYQNVYNSRDNIGSNSNINTNNANTIHTINNGVRIGQLPVVGMQTVEIQNPNINIKPSPIDVTGINQFGAINHYPGAILTTPIPMFSTATSFLTPQPIITSTTPETINIQNYVDSLTQFGAQNQHGTMRGQNSPSYNPMNFIPNIDLINSQSMLNGKSDPLPSQLNLVPLVPGGKFYKHSHAAQADLVSKPKLSSDLEKYAEEMFKESVRTIYNTHKWNTDKRLKDFTSSEMTDYERLKNELERIKGNKYSVKEPLEAHQSETQFRTTEPGRSTKRPIMSVAELEELFKSDFKLNGDSSLQNNNNNNNHNNNNNRPEIGEVTKLTDYLTPPRVNSFVSKSKFIDKNVKKRPGKNRHARPNYHTTHKTRPVGPEASASNHISYSYRRPHYNRKHPTSDYRKSQNFDNYPTFTTSSPDDIFHHQTSKNDHFDINHPRSHNLMGLMMKNKQLPPGTSASQANFYRDDDYKQYYDNDQRRIHEEAMKNGLSLTTELRHHH